MSVREGEKWYVNSLRRGRSSIGYLRYWANPWIVDSASV